MKRFFQTIGWLHAGKILVHELKHSLAKGTRICSALSPQIKNLSGTPFRTIIAGIIVLLLAAMAISLASCNVTRTITNESQYFQRGDTSIVIQTKTIETYDASKK